jgi:hypothetical protein
MNNILLMDIVQGHDQLAYVKFGFGRIHGLSKFTWHGRLIISGSISGRRIKKKKDRMRVLTA